MNLRFRILTQANDYNPADYDGQSVDVEPVAVGSIGLLIEIDGSELLNVAAGSLTGGTTASDTIEGKSIDFEIEDDDYYKVGISTEAVTYSSQVRIRITYENAHTYDQIFTVFGYDLGDNPDLTVPEGFENLLNPFDIELVPFVFLDPGPIIAEVSDVKIFSYRDRETNNLHLVKANTVAGIYSWRTIDSTSLYPAGALLGTGDTIIVSDPEGEITKLLVSNKAVPNPHVGTSGDDIDVDADVVAPVINDPVVTEIISNEGICEACNCIETTSAVEITLTGTVITPLLLGLDGLYHTLFGVFLHSIKLVDGITGLEVDEVTSEVEFNGNDPFTTSTYSYDIPDTIEVDRYYVLTYELIAADALDYNEGDVILTKVINLYPCSYRELERTDCGNAVWTNKGLEATLVVKKYDPYGVLTTIQTSTDVATGDEVTLALEDGVYIIEISRDGDTVYSYKFVTMCAVMNCINAQIKKLACQEDPCKDCDCEDCDKLEAYDIGVLGLGVVSYFNLLNLVQSTNYIFTSLSDAEETTLTDLAKLTAQIELYCGGCGCN